MCGWQAGRSLLLVVELEVVVVVVIREFRDSRPPPMTTSTFLR